MSPLDALPPVAGHAWDDLASSALLALAAAAVAALVVQPLLSSLGLSRAHLGGLGWCGLLAGALAFTRVGPSVWGLHPDTARLAALGVAVVATALWLNDPTAARTPPRGSSEVNGSAPRTVTRSPGDPSA